MKRPAAYLELIGPMLLVVAADQLTKFWVLDAFRASGEARAVIPGFFNLVLVANTGAAFGFLAGEYGRWRQIFFVAVAVFALVVMVFAYHHFRACGRLYGVAIGMIAGGALGNLIDRLRFGAVVDFLDFFIKGYHWPAFNVADSAITVGVGLFLLISFLESGKERL
ncbi:MAG: signal peptidase II [Deltaproteobacteria bacterium RIFOXYD12_FULL_57_12]|nr:MAG: signal peptidase II [Deltaproteobacteria bacterium RIFOXYD12_FULL_57_12]